jgi:hypothetical protein
MEIQLSKIIIALRPAPTNPPDMNNRVITPEFPALAGNASRQGTPGEDALGAVQSAYRMAAAEEEASWAALKSLRRQLHQALLQPALDAQGREVLPAVSESGARAVIASVEGLQRIDMLNARQRQALERISAHAGDDLTGAWMEAAGKWSDATDRSFRRATELADLGGNASRQLAESGTELGRVKQRILSIAEQVNPALDIRFSRQLFGEGPALIASGASSSERMAVAGMFEPYYMLASISLDPTYDVEDSAWHEAFHSIEGVLTQSERKALERSFPKDGEITTSERAAVAFADWASRRKRIEDMGLGDDTASVRTAFRRLALFSGRVGDELRQAKVASLYDMAASLPGSPLPTGAEKLFERIYAGEMGSRVVQRMSLRPAARGGIYAAGNLSASYKLPSSQSVSALPGFAASRVFSRMTQSMTRQAGRVLGLGTATEPPVPHLAKIWLAQSPSASQKLRHPVSVRYQLVELGDILTSHDIVDGIIVRNRDFPASLQPRQRDSVASLNQVTTMARSLVPELLGPGPLANHGAPIVGATGQDGKLIAESGNARSMALRLVYSDPAYAGVADRYRRQLSDWGFEADGMSMPVLVRRRVTELSETERAEFARLANDEQSLSVSTTEKAALDAARISPQTLQLWRGGPLEAGLNHGLVQSLVADIAGPHGLGGFVDRKGRVSRQGLDRLRAALVMKAYNDQDLVRDLMERPQSQAKSVANALVDAAPAVANLSLGIEEGRIPQGFSIGPELAEAYRLQARARLQDVSLTDLLDQPQMFAPELQDRDRLRSVLRLIHRNDGLTRSAGRDAIASAITDYVGRVMKSAGQEIIGKPDATPEQQRQALLDAVAPRAVAPRAASQAYAQQPVMNSAVVDAAADPASPKYSTGIFGAAQAPEFDFRRSRPAVHWLIETDKLTDLVQSKLDAQGYWEDLKPWNDAHNEVMQERRDMFQEQFPPTQDHVRDYMKENGIRNDAKGRARALTRMQEEGLFDFDGASETFDDLVREKVGELLDREIEAELEQAYVLPSSDDRYFLIVYPERSVEAWGDSRSGLSFIDYLGRFDETKIDSAIAAVRRHHITGESYTAGGDQPLNVQGSDRWELRLVKAVVPGRSGLSARQGLVRGSFAVLPIRGHAADGLDRERHLARHRPDPLNGNWDLPRDLRRPGLIVHLASGTVVAPPQASMEAARRIAEGMESLRPDWADLTLNRLAVDGGFGAETARARGRLVARQRQAERFIRPGPGTGPGNRQQAAFSIQASDAAPDDTNDPPGQRSLSRDMSQQLQRDMMKQLAEVDHSRSMSENYSNFLSMARAALSNSVLQPTSVDWARNEQAYRDSLMHYGAEWDDKEMRAAQRRFGEMLGTTAMALEHGYPILGQTAAEIGHLNKHQGQFFTPPEVARLMARMNLGDAGALTEILKAKGCISIMDPACGDGRMILAAAEALQEQGIDPQCMQGCLIDINGDAAKMAYIHTSLSGIPAVVHHGNGLTMESFESWMTPTAMLQARHAERHRKMVDALRGIGSETSPVTERIPAATERAQALTPRQRYDVELRNEDLLQHPLDPDAKSFRIGYPLPAPSAGVLYSLGRGGRNSGQTGTGTGDPILPDTANDNAIAAMYRGLSFPDEIRRNTLIDLVDMARREVYAEAILAGLTGNVEPMMPYAGPSAGPWARLLNDRQYRQVLAEVEVLKSRDLRGELPPEESQRYAGLRNAWVREDQASRVFEEFYPNELLNRTMSFSIGRDRRDRQPSQDRSNLPVRKGQVISDPSDGTLRAELLIGHGRNPAREWRSGFSTTDEIEQLLAEEFGGRYRKSFSLGHTSVGQNIAAPQRRIPYFDRNAFRVVPPTEHALLAVKEGLYKDHEARVFEEYFGAKGHAFLVSDEDLEARAAEYLDQARLELVRAGEGRRNSRLGRQDPAGDEELISEKARAIALDAMPDKPGQVDTVKLWQAYGDAIREEAGDRAEAHAAMLLASPQYADLEWRDADGLGYRITEREDCFELHHNDQLLGETQFWAAAVTSAQTHARAEDYGRIADPRLVLNDVLPADRWRRCEPVRIVFGFSGDGPARTGQDLDSAAYAGKGQLLVGGATGRGAFAVIRALPESGMPDPADQPVPRNPLGRGWIIIHLPSGLRVGEPLARREDAMAWADKISAYDVDWNGLVRGDVKAWKKSETFSGINAQAISARDDVVRDAQQVARDTGSKRRMSRLRQAGLASSGAAPVQFKSRDAEPSLNQGSLNQGHGNLQVEYVPASAGPRIGTKIPANLAGPTREALRRLTERLPAEFNDDLDAYVAAKLKFGSKEELWKALSAEQIDAVAFGIEQIDKRGSVINGDQTGGGKGRVQAALMRYAHLNGKVPLFVTERPDLYAAMGRDLAALGMGEWKIFVTNSDLRGSKAIELPASGDRPGLRIESLPPSEHDQKIAEIARTGACEGFDAVFTCYSQAQTVAGNETDRRAALRSLVAKGNTVLVRDEIHNAGGDEEQESKPGEPKNRAEFMRELQWQASSVIDSSATYAKRPKSLDNHGRTDLSHALPEAGRIGEFVASGGTAMSQIVSSALAEAGQYLRRERDMSGIEYRFETIPVDRTAADGLSNAAAAIQAFDAYKQQLVTGKLEKTLMQEAEAVVRKLMAEREAASQLQPEDPSQQHPQPSKSEVEKKPTVHSTRFTALIHNIVNQGLLSLAADNHADRMINILKTGEEKPIFGLQNTMGAFLDAFAEDNALKSGDEIGADFGDIMRRYLERSRDVSIGEAAGEKERRRITDHELGPKGQKLYADAIAAISAVDWSRMPVSPIDHIRRRVTDAGFRIDEITGRRVTIEYDTSSAGEGKEGKVIARLRMRPDSEASKANAVRIKDRFNSGDLDAVILNQSGASGIDLHASEVFSDTRRRIYIVGQAHQDINTHMQMLGRPDRLGQVSKPLYIHPLPDLPAVQRGCAILAANLKRLNASVSGNATGSFGAGAEDIFNKFGDRAAVALMEMDPILHFRLGSPLQSGDADGAARKITGRFVLLPRQQQVFAWEALQREYRAEVERATALGEDVEDAPVIPLKARSLEARQFTPGDPENDSPLKRPAFAERIEADRQRRPYSWVGAVRRLAEVQNEAGGSDLATLQRKGIERSSALSSQVTKEFETWSAERVRRMVEKGGPSSESGARKLLDRQREQKDRVTRLITQFPAGRKVSVFLTDADGARREVAGLVAGMRSVQRPGLNPAQPAAWRVRLILADSIREVEMPLSRVSMGSESVNADFRVQRAETAPDPSGEAKKRIPFQTAFDSGAARTKEERVVVTGNVLAGFHALNGKGRPVFFTAQDGAIRAGILLPVSIGFDQVQQLQPITSAKAALAHLDASRGVKMREDRRNRLVSTDGEITISAIERAGGEAGAKQPFCRISIASQAWSKATDGLRSAVGAVAQDDAVVAQGDRICAEFAPQSMEDLLSALTAAGTSLVARGDVAVDAGSDIRKPVTAAPGREAPQGRRPSSASREQLSRSNAAPARLGQTRQGQTRQGQRSFGGGRFRERGPESGKGWGARVDDKGIRWSQSGRFGYQSKKQGGFAVEAFGSRKKVAYSTGRAPFDDAQAFQPLPSPELMKRSAQQAMELVMRASDMDLDVDLLPFRFAGLGILQATPELYSGLHQVSLRPDEASARRAALGALLRFDRAVGSVFVGGDGVEKSLNSCIEAMPGSERDQLRVDLAPLMLACGDVMGMRRTLVDIHNQDIKGPEAIKKAAQLAMRVATDPTTTARLREQGRMANFRSPFQTPDMSGDSDDTEFSLGRMAGDVAYATGSSSGGRRKSKSATSGSTRSKKKGERASEARNAVAESIAAGEFRRHPDYDHFAAVRDAANWRMANAGWQAQDIPLATREGLRHFPGFIHPARPGLAVLPTPAYGSSETDFDRNEIRWRVAQVPAGYLLGSIARAPDGSIVSPVLFTPEGAANVADRLHDLGGKSWGDWATLNQEDLSERNAEKLGIDIIMAIASAKPADRELWIEQGLSSFNSQELTQAGFRTSRVWWMPVDDATSPEPPSLPGMVQLYEDQFAAFDLDGRDSIPVYVREGRVADLSKGRAMQPDALALLREFYDFNYDNLTLGIAQNAYDDASTEDIDNTEAEKRADEAVKNFTFEAFVDALRVGDLKMAGEYDGDLKDALASALGDRDFDTVIFASPWSTDQNEIVVLRPSSLRFAWDQLEPAMIQAKEQAQESERRDNAWRTKYSEAEQARMAADRDEAISQFDLGSLAEGGFDTASRSVLWLASQKAEFPEVPDDGSLELLGRRSQVEALKLEATPVYLRRGRLADLSEIGTREIEIMADAGIEAAEREPVRLRNAIASGELARNEGLRNEIAAAFEEAGYHAIRYPGHDGDVTIAFDTSDIAIAWDVLGRNRLERRLADLQAGPALAAARRAAQLAAPQLLIGGQSGEYDQELAERTRRNAFDGAEIARRILPAGTILIFQDDQGFGHIFDGDARRAADLVQELNLIETGSGAETAASVRLSPQDLERLSRLIGEQHAPGAAVVGIDGQDRIVLDRFDATGYRRDIVDEQREDELLDPARLAELQREQRRQAWTAKPVAERYEDLARASRKAEIPGLVDGERIVFHGDKAELAIEASALMKSRASEVRIGKDALPVTWISASDAVEHMRVGEELAAAGLTLCIGETYDRRSWKIFTSQSSKPKTFEDEWKAELPTSSSELYEIVKRDHRDDILLVAHDDDGVFKAYGADAAFLSEGLGLELKSERNAANEQVSAVHVPTDMAAGLATEIAARPQVASMVGDRRIVLAHLRGDINDARIERTVLDVPKAGFAADPSSASRSASGPMDGLKSPQDGKNASASPGVARQVDDARLALPATEEQIQSLIEPSYQVWQEIKAGRPSRLVFIREQGNLRSFGADARTATELSHRLVSMYRSSSQGGRAVGEVSFGDWMANDVIEDLRSKGRSISVVASDAEGRLHVSDFDGPDEERDSSSWSSAPSAGRNSDRDQGISLEDRIRRDAQDRASRLPPPTSPQALRLHLEEALQDIARLGPEPRADQVSGLLQGRGLLNTKLHKQIAAESREIFPLNSGYAIWRHPNTRHWHIDSYAGLIEKFGPDGSLAGSFPKAAIDILQDFSGEYLKQLDATFANDLAGMKQEILQLGKDINPNADIAFVERLFADGNSVAEGGADTRDRQPVLGLYFRMHQLVGISTDITRGDPRVTAAHEFFHGVEEMLDEKQQDVLTSYFPPKGGMTSSERAAEAFARWLTHRYGMTATTPVKDDDADARGGRSDASKAARNRFFASKNRRIRNGIVAGRFNSGNKPDIEAVPASPQYALGAGFPVANAADPQLDRVFAPITRFMERSSSMLKGHGFQTWDDVFEAVRTGEVASRARIFDVTAAVAPAEAVRLARMAGLPRLATALAFYGSRTDRRELTGEGLYRLLRRQLDDVEILKLLNKADYSGIADPGYATNLMSTRSALSQSELTRHSRVTPIEVPSIQAAARIIQTAPGQSAARPMPSPAGLSGSGMSEAAGYRQPMPGSYGAGSYGSGGGGLSRMASRSSAMPMASDGYQPRPAWGSRSQVLARPSGGAAMFKQGEPIAAEPFGQKNAVGPNGHNSTPTQSFALEGLNMVQTLTAARTGAFNPIMTRNPGFLPTMPDHLVPLYVSHDEFTRLKNEKAWPVDQDATLAYDPGNRHWWIDPDHPAFDRLADYGTPQAKRVWESAIRAGQDLRAKIAGRETTTSEENRIYLYVPINDVPGLRKIPNADFDSARGLWWVSRNHPRAEELAGKYSTQDAVKTWSEERVELFQKQQQRAAASGLPVGLTLGAAAAAFVVTRPDEARTLAEAGAELGATAGRQLMEKVQSGQVSPDGAHLQVLTGDQIREMGGKAGELAGKAGEAISGQAAEWKAQAAGLADRSEAALDAARGPAGETLNEVGKEVAAKGGKILGDTSDLATSVGTKLKSGAENAADAAISALQGNDTSFAGQVKEGASAIVQTAQAKFSELAAMAPEQANTTLGVLKAHGTDIATKVAAAKSELVQSVAAKLGGVSSVGKAAGAGVATADALVSAGLMTAALGTAIWLRSRSARLSAYESTAREAPWVLTPAEFGQVANRLYTLERGKNANGQHRVTLLDKATKEPVFTMVTAEKQSARSAITALHLEQVVTAQSKKVFVPDRVALAHALETERHVGRDTEQLFSRRLRTQSLVDLSRSADTRPLGNLHNRPQLAQAAFKWSEKIPAVRIDAKHSQGAHADPEELRARQDVEKALKAMRPAELDGTLAKTVTKARKANNRAEDRADFVNGRAIVAKLQAERALESTQPSLRKKPKRGTGIEFD